MKKLILLPAFFLTLCSLSSQAQQATTATPDMKPVAATAKITHKVIAAPENTFGYDVYSDGRLLVHQPSIPGQPGNKGFKTKADAEKVAILVTGKIKKGEMPPSVTTEELKKLKVI